MDIAYRLQLRSPLHVGRSGIGLEGTLAYMPSDTLFAAFVSKWALLYTADELAQWLAPFVAGRPPFLLTSAFPYAGDVRFFPAPASQLPLSRAARAAAGKRLKRLTHVSEGILAAWLAGAALDGEVQGEEPGQPPRTVANFIQGGRAWVTSDERRRVARALGLPADEPAELTLWSEAIVPHVAVGRPDNRSNLFHTGRVFFTAGCGLWFGVAGADATWQARIEQALALMADSGMGGLRAKGNGAFTWRADAGGVALPMPQSGDRALLLSRAAPDETQMAALLHADARYRLVTVGGWCGNEGELPRKRRRVRLLAEGSVVHWAGPTLGTLVDVNPRQQGLAHPVYRYGYGFPVKVAPPAPEVMQ